MRDARPNKDDDHPEQAETAEVDCEHVHAWMDAALFVRKVGIGRFHVFSRVCGDIVFVHDILTKWGSKETAI